MSTSPASAWYRLAVRRRRGRRAVAEESTGGRRGRCRTRSQLARTAVVYVTNQTATTSPSTTSARAGAVPQDSRDRLHRRSRRPGGEPGRRERLRRHVRREDDLPVRRRPRRWAFAEDPRHGTTDASPARLAVSPDGEASMSPGVFAQHLPVRLGPAAAVAEDRPRGPPIRAMGSRSSPDGRSVYVANTNSEHRDPVRVGTGGRMAPKTLQRWAAWRPPIVVGRCPPRPPDHQDQCKDRGWRNFPGFKNQGDCVSFVATKGKNAPS